ncbi:MAG: hypothetical protein Q8R98_21845 [Rubrivivax sp.]|nr:hypothetical protein [Rubrivivax sp.]MDP3226030.1 hypothetical protein [Rubrivivax sp.]MDP3614496.1 hypothetical protein [Rubrivivax sp.]
MSALLAGATGLIGRELAAHWTGPGPLHLLVRRAMPAAHPLHRVHVVDFAALPPLPSAQLGFCCLGTTIKAAGSQAAFRAVDHTAVLAFARAARRAGVRHFAVVSSLGASVGARSFYSRVKGEMEDELKTLGFASLVIARPSLLIGDRSTLAQPPRRGERLAQTLSAPFLPLIPVAWRPIAAATVARALLRALSRPEPGVRVLLSAQLQELGA